MAQHSAVLLSYKEDLLFSSSLFFWGVFCFCFFIFKLLFRITLTVHHHCFQMLQAALFKKDKASTKPSATFQVQNDRKTTFVTSWWTLAAKETDLSLRSWLRPKVELKERKYQTYTCQMADFKRTLISVYYTSVGCVIDDCLRTGPS